VCVCVCFAGNVEKALLSRELWALTNCSAPTHELLCLNPRIALARAIGAYGSP
jgi:hypothetical protein